MLFAMTMVVVVMADVWVNGWIGKGRGNTEKEGNEPHTKEYGMAPGNLPYFRVW